MSYYSGIANSITDLKTAFLTHAQADGWALFGDVLSKAGVYFRIQESGSSMTCLGCTDNAVANPAPNVAQVGNLAYPCNYEVFGFAQEIYLVAKYNTEYYQWLAFGKSTVPGLPGSGAWCGATWGGSVGAALAVNTTPVDYDYSSGALFWNSGAPDNYATKTGLNSWVYSNLDAGAWYHGTDLGNVGSGVLYISTLLSLLPNSWNSETSLLPMREYKRRSSNKTSLVADLEHSRNLRIDNLAPGDILTIGPDKWKVYPWYRKNAAARDGGTNITHTGTFGWAIRYEGP